MNKEIRQRLFVGAAVLTLAFVASACRAPVVEVNNPGRIIINGRDVTGQTLTIGTPKPSEAPGRPRTPTRPQPKEAVKFEPYTYTELKKGDIFYAEPGDIVVGDLVINGRVDTYDREENTGLISKLPHGGKVYAFENAGSVLHPNLGADVRSIIEQQEREMREAHPEIKSVTIQTVPGDRLQGQTDEATRTQTSGLTGHEISNVNRKSSTAIKEGETRSIPAGTIMRIDGTVNGVRLHDVHDGSERTGAEIIFEVGASLYANYAGSGLTGLPIDTDTLNQEADKQALASFEANPNFDSITIYTVKANGEITSRVKYRQ